jgi:transposase
VVAPGGAGVRCSTAYCLSCAPALRGRALRRYHRRWKIERLFAWLQNYRRLAVRWEYRLDNFLSMLHFACALILMRPL